MKLAHRLARVEVELKRVPDDALIWSAADKIFGFSSDDESLAPPMRWGELSRDERTAMDAAGIDGLAMLFSWVDARLPDEDAA